MDEWYLLHEMAASLCITRQTNPAVRTHKDNSCDNPSTTLHSQNAGNLQQSYRQLDGFQRK